MSDFHTPSLSRRTLLGAAAALGATTLPAVAHSKIVLRMFNMDIGDYKRFLNFLRKHDCQLPFKEYR